MFRLESDTALLKTFRPKDRSIVELPPGSTYPLFVRHYLAWPHPAGGRVFLVFSTPTAVPTGISFDTNASGPAVPHMCDWCHCAGLGTQVGLLTATVNRQKRAGIHACVDLSCAQKLEDEANRSGRSPLPAIEALLLRMGRFASEALKIDLSGAGR
jgi:hypothetical protein